MAHGKTAAPAGTHHGMGPLLGVVGVLALSLFLAFFLSKTSGLLVLGGFFGMIILAVSFMKPEFGVAILIISMLLSPEIGAGAAGSGGSAEASRSVVVRLDDILLALLSAAWFARTAVHKDLGLIRKNPLNRPIGLYTLSCFISTIIGVLAGNVKIKLGFFFVVRYIEYFIVFFISMNVINSEKIMRRFMKIAFFTAVAVALYGLSQIPLGIRVSAPFEGDQGEPNTMGGYLLLMMCMAGGQLIFARGLRRILMWSGFLVLLFVPMLFTGSRASWLGIPAAMAAFFAFSHRKRQILILMVFMIGSAQVILPQSVKERILFTFKQQKQIRAKQLVVGGVRLDTSTTARLESYKVSLDGWRQKPILGWGVTGFVFIDSQFVRTLAETGLLGMGALIWLFWGYFQSGRAAMRAAPNGFQRGIAIGYLAALFGLVTHSSGSNTFIILRIMEPWMLFTAMVVRIPGIAEERERAWETFAQETREMTDEDLEAELEEAIEKSRHDLRGEEKEEKAGEAPPAEGEEEEEAGGGSDRFEKKLSEYEQFLERERREDARRAIEARLETARALPKFRRAQQAQPRVPGKTFQPRPMAPPGTPPASPQEKPAGAEGGGPSARPRRAVDLIRETPKRSMAPPMRRK